jgi:predicted DNA-binding transcriptional regulator YafY
MNRTDRLLAIVLELQVRGKRRAEDLAARFETSKRTIYRDIQALSEAGVPVVAQPGQGYSLMEGYFLPPMSFSADEAVLLLLGLDSMSGSFDKQYGEAARTTADKIEAVLPEAVREDVARLRTGLTVVPFHNSEAENEKLGLLRRAIFDCRPIRFHYTTKFDESGTPREAVRDVEPYRLIKAGYWYLAGHCRMRDDARFFRLDRMAEVMLLEGKFERPSKTVLDRLREDRQERKVPVKLLFSQSVARWVREERYYSESEARETPEGLLLTLKVYQEGEILRWLLGWGGNVTVVEPESLRLRVIEEAKKILESANAVSLLT